MPYNKEDHRIDQGRRYAKRRQQIINHLGGVCIVCGSSDELEIHHINQKEKSFNVSKRYDSKWEILEAELKKCELRCSTHHKEKHSTGHGKLGMYRHHKCRCEECRLAWNKNHREYMRKYRAEKAIT